MAPAAHPNRKRVLFSGCLAHVTLDGLTDMLYVFLPVWQQAFGLSFTGIGMLRTSFSGALALFQIPSGLLAGKFGILPVLSSGMFLTGSALCTIGFVPFHAALGILLILGGIGASTQHPLASSAIANVYSGNSSRAALSTYNFSGDVGKFIVPLIASFLIAYAGWQRAISTLGLVGFLSGAVLFAALFRIPLEHTTGSATSRRSGFSFFNRENALSLSALSVIGIIDNSTRGGFLTLLPFLLQEKGAGLPSIGLALSLTFAGGAAGKLVCGIMAARVGVLRSVVVTEIITAACIFSMIGLTLESVLVLCPFFGIALNGTSSVLYGSVPELVSREHRNEAFAFFYTCTIGAGAVSPFLYGLLSDAAGIHVSVTAISALVLVTIPLTIVLKGKLGTMTGH